MNRHRRPTAHERDQITRHEGRRDSRHPVGGRVDGGYLEIDVGHQRLDAAEAVRRVEEAIRRVKRSGDLRVLKIVHGRGRGPAGGAIRREVRGLLRDLPGLRSVIPGERYDLFHPGTRAMRTEAGQPSDPDLGRGNEGITLVWVR